MIIMCKAWTSEQNDDIGADPGAADSCEMAMKI